MRKFLSDERIDSVKGVKTMPFRKHSLLSAYLFDFKRKNFLDASQCSMRFAALPQLSPEEKYLRV
jgi:hypothetical protein